MPGGEAGVLGVVRHEPLLEAGNPGVVDQDVKPAEGGLKPGGGCLPLGFVAHVEPPPGSPIADAEHHSRPFGFLNVGDHDRRPLGGKPLGDAAADPPGGAGHQRDLSLHSVHRVLLRERLRIPRTAAKPWDSLTGTRTGAHVPAMSTSRRDFLRASAAIGGLVLGDASRVLRGAHPDAPPGSAQDPDPRWDRVYRAVPGAVCPGPRTSCHPLQPGPHQSPALPDGRETGRRPERRPPVAGGPRLGRGHRQLRHRPRVGRAVRRPAGAPGEALRLRLDTVGVLRHQPDPDDGGRAGVQPGEHAGRAGEAASVRAVESTGRGSRTHPLPGSGADRPPIADRRPRGPDRPVHLLAGADRAGRGGAGPWRRIGSGADHRRAGPVRVDDPAGGAGGDGDVQRAGPEAAADRSPNCCTASRR